MKLTFLRLARIAVLPVVLGVWWGNAGHSIARAADPHAHFVGDVEDNFWNVGESTCPHWIMIAAKQIYQSGTTIINEDPTHPYTYSLQLVSVTNATTGAPIPLTVKLPYRIAGANGPPLMLRRGFVVVPFRQAIPSGTMLSIEIDRWDHGNTNATDDTGDHTAGDDQIFFLNDASSPCNLIPTPA
jgi:hypothetical protein